MGKLQEFLMDAEIGTTQTEVQIAPFPFPFVITQNRPVFCENRIPRANNRFSSTSTAYATSF